MCGRRRIDPGLMCTVERHHPGAVQHVGDRILRGRGVEDLIRGHRADGAGAGNRSAEE
ncbi:hypothetical protein Agsp01_02980 [Agromyces sp. NBRC 114283]|nr:hypothetical protein Agsp01_02980 [Agromyces sp. NBRC 114283]